MKTLEDALEQITSVFLVMEKRGSKKSDTEEERKSRTYRWNTNSSYAAQVKSYMKWVYDRYGITDPYFLKTRYAEEYIVERIDHFHQRVIAASTIKVAIHALYKYQEALRSQLNYRFRIINKDHLLELCAKKGVIRKLATAKKGRKINGQQALKMVREIQNARSEHAEVMAKIAEFQYYTGGRISATLRIQVQNIDIQNCKITFEHDKGNKTRTVQDINPIFMKKLSAWISGLKPGRQVFALFGQEGNLKSIEQSRKEIEKVYARCAKRIGLNGANTHSQRKAFAQERYKSYMQLSYKKLQKLVANRIQEDTTGLVANRVKAVLANINRSRKEPRGFYPEELACLLASFDIGHNRIDVMRFYIDRDFLFIRSH